MKRRDLLKTMAALPVGAVATRAGAGSFDATGGPVAAATNEVEGWNWLDTILDFDLMPGEITFLAGRRVAGKTSLALEIALGLDTRDDDRAWFFCGAGRAHETAALLGIELEAVEEQAVGLDYYTRVYRCRLDGALLKMSFIDSTKSYGAALGELRAAYPCLSRQPEPKLVIYDADRFDFDNADEDWTDLLTAEFHERRQDCEETFDAAMLMTVNLTYAEHMHQDDRRPGLEKLRLNARKAMIADQVYFIERPVTDWATTLDLVSVTRAYGIDVIGTYRSGYMLARDAHTGRFRDLTKHENFMSLGLARKA